MNNNSKIVVSGKFQSENDVQQTVKWLDGKGIGKEDINILINNRELGQDFKINTSNKIPEHAVKGLTTGTIIGAIFGSLSVIGVLIVPVAGIAIAGPVIGAIAGVAIGGLTGVFIGTFVGMTIPKYEAVFFEDNFEKSIFLIVKVNKVNKKEIKKNLVAFGATNIAAR